MEWCLPDELRPPGTNPLRNLIIIVLTSRMAGNDGISLLGQILHEDAELNRTSGTGGSRSPERATECSVKASRVHRDIYEAWKEFAQRFQQGGRTYGTADLEHRAFVATLHQGLETYRQLRSR